VNFTKCNTKINIQRINKSGELNQYYIVQKLH